MFRRGLRGGAVFIPVPEDVFQDYDGVVHHHAHPQGQASQGHQVEGEIEKKHQRKGGQHGNGNGQGDHHGAAHGSQEKQQDQDRQTAAVHHGPGHIGDGTLNEVSLVDDRNDPDLGHGGIDGIDFFEDAVRHLHGIGLGLFPDRHPDTGFAVDPDDPGQLFIGVVDPGHLSQGHGGAVLAGHHGVPDLVQVTELGRGPQLNLVPPLFQFAGRLVQVGLPDRADDLIQGQSQRHDPVRVQFDADFPVVPAPYVHLCHARDPGKPVPDLVFNEPGQVHRIQPAGDAQQHHRKTADIEFSDSGPFNIIGQFIEFILENGPDIQGRKIDIRIPGEPDLNIAVSFRGVGCDLFHARHRGNDLFNYPGHLAFHDFGAGADVFRSNAQGGHLDFREHVDLEPAQGHRADHQGHENDHGDEHRPVNTEFGQIHPIGPGERSGSGSRDPVADVPGLRPVRTPALPGSAPGGSAGCRSPPGARSLFRDPG